MKKIITIFIFIFFLFGCNQTSIADESSINVISTSETESFNDQQKSNNSNVSSGMLSSVFTGIALVGTILFYIVTYINLTPVELILMPVKERNLAIFIQVTMVLGLTFLWLIILGYSANKGNIIDLFFALIYAVLVIALLIKVARTPNIYIFNPKEKVLYRIISRVDEEHLFIDYSKPNKYGRKIVTVSSIRNKRIYTSTKKLMDKPFNMSEIKEALKK